MSRIIDVSQSIFPGMTVWPGDEPVALSRQSKIEEGAHANVSRLTCSVHTGTHVDAPFHFLRDGKTIEALPGDVLVGSAWVADIPTVRVIGAADLDAAGIPADTRRLLLRTRNSVERRAPDAPFTDQYAGLDAGGAEWVARHGIRLLGTDYLSVACREQTGPVHEILLGREIVLVEGLVLADVPPGACRFYCLPLKLVGSDGAPARAVVEVE